MEVAVAAIIAATAAVVGIAVLLCVYRLITLLGDPVNAKLMSRSLLNIAKRSLLRLMLSCVGLASKHAAG